MPVPTAALSPREHARLARDLISACGGLEEAARACRVGKSSLANYQNASDPLTMPADIMDALEEYAQQGPIYSGAIAERRMFPTQVANLADAACDLSEQTLETQSLIRKALADNHLSPRELDAIVRAERDAEAALERLKSARRAIEAAQPTHLRAV